MCKPVTIFAVLDITFSDLPMSRTEHPPHYISIFRNLSTKCELHFIDKGTYRNESEQPLYFLNRDSGQFKYF